MDILRKATTWAIMQIMLSLWELTKVEGQGYRPSGPTVLGANVFPQLQQLYQHSQAYKVAYRQRPKAACSRTSGGLCAAAASNDAESYAVLMLATSPQLYSSSDTQQTGGVSMTSTPGDQGPCQTCTAFAVASAAETAMAATMHLNVQNFSISVQALYFCPEQGPTQTCDAGGTLLAALQQLQQRGTRLPVSECLPYKPDLRGDFSKQELCNTRCNKVNAFAGQGTFSSTGVTSMWQAQRHIRQYGGVVSRFDVYSDFRDYFKGKPEVVYQPGKGAVFAFGHAVLLVGYNNAQQYWLVKNSWGTGWADHGFFRVAYGVCSVLTPATGEAYGVIWNPQTTPTALQLPVTPAGTPDCYSYQAVSGDYLSLIAWRSGIALDQLLLDNVDRVKDLDTQLTGTQLLLCNPRNGRYVVMANTTGNSASSPSCYKRYLEHDSYGGDLNDGTFVHCRSEQCCAALCDQYSARCSGYVWAYDLPKSSTWYMYCWLKQGRMNPLPLPEHTWATHGLLTAVRCS